MHFIQPALASHQVDFYFLTKKHSPLSIKHYNDLAPLTIATLRGNQYFKQFDLDNQLKKFKAVNYQSAVNMVLNNRVDVLIDLSLTPPSQLANADTNSELIRQPFQPVENINEYIALSKHSAWGAHIAQVNQAMQHLTENGIIAQYFAQITQLEKSKVTNPTSPSS